MDTTFYISAHALIERDDNYLITKRASIDTYKPMKWDIPGGTVCCGETIEEGLLREVKEETGLVVEIQRLLFIYTNLDQYPERQTFQVVYLCNYIEGHVILNPIEHDSFMWVNKLELVNIKESIDFLEKFISNSDFFK